MRTHARGAGKSRAKHGLTVELVEPLALRQPDETLHALTARALRVEGHDERPQSLELSLVDYLAAVVHNPIIVGAMDEQKVHDAMPDIGQAEAADKTGVDRRSEPEHHLDQKKMDLRTFCEKTVSNNSRIQNQSSAGI